MNNIPLSDNRRIQVFISSILKDLIGDRNALMTHTFPDQSNFFMNIQIEKKGFVVRNIS
jgi:hypothetical protein